jgi:allantoinase
MNNPFFSYSPIVSRPVLQLPEGKRIAVWFGLNLEHYEQGKPALSLVQLTAGLTPDPINYGWREYGPRVGVWRMIELFDQLGLQPTAIVNSDVIVQHPQIVAAGIERRWCWVAHGKNNSTWQGGMEPAAERARIKEVTETIAEATGVRPRGWLGPSRTTSDATNDLLAELGYSYSLDWGIDDEPVRFDVAAGELVSVPYHAELNDILFFVVHGQTGAEFRQALIDHFDQLYTEGEQRPRIMGFGLHPFLSGQPYRLRYVREALEHIAGYDGVWFPTADEIANWYLGIVRSTR